MSTEERFQRILATRDIVPWPQTVLIISSSAATIDDNSITQWLETHVGRCGDAWTVRHRQGGMQYRFRDQSHKTLFALTWL